MQNYTEIAANLSLQASLPLLLGNDKTALSNSSGSTFPTSNLQVGMFCYRTDQKKLYELTDLTPTWTLIIDISSGVAVCPQASTVLGWVPVQQGGGTGQGANKLYMGWDGVSKLLLQVDTTNYGSTWPISISGDAATLGGRAPGNASGGIPVSNGTANVNLNADMVDGFHAGNNAGQVPVSNGTVSTNLNADLLDGFHAASFVRTISGVAPDASGNVMMDLTTKADRDGSGNYTALGGSVTAYTAVIAGLTPKPGTCIVVNNGVGANTGAATLSVNGGGATAVQVWQAGALRGLNAGEFPAGVVALRYTGAAWVLLDDAIPVRYGNNGVVKSGDSLGLAGLHGGGYIDLAGTANGGIVGTGAQSARFVFDGFGRVTAAWTTNCNCNCNCCN